MMNLSRWMRRSACAMIVALGSFAVLDTPLALDTPVGLSSDKRIRTVNYTPNDIVQIVGRYRASTQVEFDPTEEIAHIAIGDSIAWEVAPAKNILFLKPRERNPPTNLQVVTVRQSGERRIYQFELIAKDGEITQRDSFFVVRFKYPSDEAERRRLEGLARAAASSRNLANDVLSLHQSHGARNWRYSAQGSRLLQPDSIYDDGKVTTMRFAGNRDVPAIFLVKPDGQEVLVPWDARDGGEVLVVHATAAEFRLRQGDEVLCIYNEAFDPIGVNPGTGTTSPSVERVIRNQPRGSQR